MMQVKSFAILILISALALVSQAQVKGEGVSYNLPMLFALTEEHNNEIKKLQLEMAANKSDLAINKSKYLPQINALLDYNWYYGDLPTYVFPSEEGAIISGGNSNGVYPVSLGLPNNMYAGLTLSQTVFEYSFFHAAKGKAIVNNISSLKIQEKKDEVYYEVAVSYFELLKLLEKSDLLEFNYQRLTKLKKIVETRLKNQMGDSLDLMELSLRQEELQIKKHKFESGIEGRKQHLAFIVGLPDSIKFNVVNTDFKSINSLLNTSLTNTIGPKHALIDQAKQMEDLKAKQIQSDYLPSLDLRFSLLWNMQSENFAFFSQQSINNQVGTLGFNLDIPIYAGNAKKHKLQKTKLNTAILDLQKERLDHAYALQKNNALENLEHKTETHKHQLKVLDLRTKRLDIANAKFDNGIISITDLLKLQFDLIESQVEEKELYFDVKIAEHEYLKWTNQLQSWYAEK